MKAKGIEVNKNYYQWKAVKITRGLFEFENPGSEPISFSIEDIKCRISKSEIDISEFYVYKLPDYKEIQATNIDIEPNSRFQLEITFPAIVPPKGLLEDIFIEIKVKSEAFSKICLSPYLITIRKKK